MATNDVLDRLEALMAAATPGPWEPAKLGPTGLIPAVIQREAGDWVPIAYFSGDDGEGEAADFEHNQPLIAALRNAAPALIRLARAVLAVDDWTTKTDYEMKLACNEKSDAIKALGEVRL